MAADIEGKAKAAGRSAVWYTAATFLTKGLGFITIPIFTRIMTTGEFGLYNNFAAWQVILLSLFSLEGYATLNRARLDIHGKQLQDYQFTLLTSGMGLTFLLAMLLLVAPGVPESLTDLDRQYLYIMVLYLLFQPAFTMFQTLQRVQYRYKLSAGLSLGASLLATLLSVALVLVLPDALMGRIVGQYVPFAVLGIGFYLWYWKTGGRFRLEHLKYAIPLCVPLVIAALGGQILLLGCRIVTQHTCGADQVAFLSLATTLAQIALILINALNNAWAPWLYDCLEAGASDKATGTFKVYIWGIAVLTVLVSLFAPELVLLLGGEEYAPTIWLVPSFMANCLLGMLTNQYVYLETYHKDVRAGGVATLLLGLLNLPLCWLFVTALGFEYVGYANIVSNALLVLVHKIIVRKFDSPDVFSLKTSGLPLLVGLTSMPVSLVLYACEVDWLRYALIAAIACLGAIWLFKVRSKILLVGKVR
ncbi:hypothetical protein C1878_03810 [Gordonibacter sp. 28C]|uniref:lipopolysaccharide biosynthesis protein n=1 Tax=Gordonibacter sp. 28C TaxID=2078569 RepID=UPI000DF7D209|nr:lipopolysaccharide biosynthesis protein [Gordonibacter sp. 28C]RDB63922.1 hypothetical protein C1878_03810 [Gordonibacter sp. 28C]